MVAQKRIPGGCVIEKWNPEDPVFWAEQGSKAAYRNLWVSTPALLLAFAVWMVWSTVVVELPNIGFKFTTEELFWLVSLPGLSGATLRIFYSFMVPIFGGRNWTVITTASLLLPALGMGYAVQDVSTPYWVFLVLALFSGFGGGNFASSMSNISFFFPKAQKGLALGINAGLGNLGVSAVQFFVPLVTSFALFGDALGAPQAWNKAGVSKQLWLQNGAFVWVPLIALVTILALFMMNNLATAKASFKEQSIIFKRKHNWLMCVLYTGTFGSFIGYSAGFPLLIKTQFPDQNPLQYAFLGPLVGALVRPLGGWLADKIGGARVTFWNYIFMTAAVFGVLNFLGSKDFFGFLTMFILLFLTTGIGNGSTFRMVPVIFLNEREKAAAGKDKAAQENAVKEASKESAAVIGFSAAIAAYGAFIIPKSFGFSMAQTGGPQAALYGFVVFYAICLVITWWFYSRKGAEAPC